MTRSLYESTGAVKMGHATKTLAEGQRRDPQKVLCKEKYARFWYADIIFDPKWGLKFSVLFFCWVLRCPGVDFLNKK